MAEQLTAQGDRTREVYREDGELIGLLRESGDLWIPCAVFGSALASPRGERAAEEFLLDHGLGYLADRWQLREGDDWVTVQIVEARPLEVTVSYADYGHPALFNSRKTLRDPGPAELRRE